MSHPNQCKGGHSWAPTGIYIDRAIHVPCRRKWCRAELKQVWQEIEGPGHTIQGLELDIDDDAKGGVSKTVCRETALLIPSDFEMKPGDVVIDIGAHVGIVSIYLAKRYPGIKVLAFEPVLANFQRLERNVRANKVMGIIPYRIAVTGDGRRVRISGDSSHNSGGHSIYGPSSDVAVGSMTLAHIFEHYHIERCKVLKIDCEGAEHEILLNSGDLLKRVDYLCGEIHQSRQLESAGYTPERLLEFCRQHVNPLSMRFDVARLGE